MKTKFEWKYCSHCERMMIECPNCGNNCCNGGYGEVDGEPCDICEYAYQYQDQNTPPPIPYDVKHVNFLEQFK